MTAKNTFIFRKPSAILPGLWFGITSLTTKNTGRTSKNGENQRILAIRRRVALENWLGSLEEPAVAVVAWSDSISFIYKALCSEHNDGVHRVAAGGGLKNRKPTGRNSGATLCYALPGSRTTVSLRLTDSLSLQNSPHFARL